MANQSSCDLRINACVWVLSNTKHKKYPELTKNHYGTNASRNSVMIALGNVFLSIRLQAIT